MSHDHHVRVLEGTKVVDIDHANAVALLAGVRPVVVDVGSGDGRWPYENARKDRDSFYIGLDPDAAAMAEYAYRAARKPSRGGVDNVMFVVASLEQLPVELAGSAGRVRVNYPWAGLLRGILLPQQEALAGLTSLMARDAVLELVLTYDADHDSAALEGAALPSLSEAYVESALAPAYGSAGLTFDEVRRLSLDEALAIPSTWGRRLLHGRARDVFLIRAARHAA
jgi:16S rRNA (adenine(1408)-N(1))-methyltransferase